MIGPVLCCTGRLLLGKDTPYLEPIAAARFYDEIGNFHANSGNDLAPGSPAVHEKAASPRPQSLVTAWSMATMLIELGGEHVTAFAKTITAPVEPIACLTCVRSMLESCALASWLLDPRIGARTRIGRVFAIRHEGIEQQLKFVRATGGSGEDLQSIEKRSDEVEQVALKLDYLGLVFQRPQQGVFRVPTLNVGLDSLFEELQQEPTRHLCTWDSPKGFEGHSGPRANTTLLGLQVPSF